VILIYYDKILKVIYLTIKFSKEVAIVLMHIKKKNQYINILIIPDSQHKIKNLRIKKSIVTASIVSLAAVLLIMFSITIYYAGSYSYLYTKLKYKDNIIAEKEQKIAQLSNMKKSQDTKIAMLNDNAKKIDEKMKSLDDLEQKVRRMLGLNQPKTSRGGISRDERNISFDNISTNKLISEIDNKTIDYKNLLSEVTNKLDYLNSIPSAYPVNGNITSPFGNRVSPYDNTIEFHPGIDLAVDSGTPVKAAGKGIVTYAGWLSGYGNTVMIDHNYGITSVYGHNSQILVTVGQTVNRGDVIAKSGNSGRSTGPHVHFEVRLNGNPVDPMNYLPKEMK
jgi:murein DD-endopeptidase MepM/ murein hydrolase activator NlpD